MVKIGSDSKKYVPQITESSEKTHLENLRISLNKLCEITVTIWKPNARISHSGDLKSRLCEGQISNGWAFAMAKPIVPTIQNPDIFVQIFNFFFTKWRPSVWISNHWASGFQIPFEIRTICNLTSFWPFKIQTTPDFRSPLYSSEYGCIGHVTWILTLEYRTLILSDIQINPVFRC